MAIGRRAPIVNLSLKEKNTYTNPGTILFLTVRVDPYDHGTNGCKSFVADHSRCVE